MILSNENLYFTGTTDVRASLKESAERLKEIVNHTPTPSEERPSNYSENKKSSFTGDICSTLKMLFSAEMLKFWP